MTLVEQCAREIDELHAFFQQWFRGEVPETDDVFARFANVLDTSFRMISPEGSDFGRDHVLSMVRRGHGNMNDPPIKIWIEHHRPCVESPDLAVVAYQEWQELEGRPQGRHSVAVFCAAPDTPHGVRWQLLQETWLEESDGAT